MANKGGPFAPRKTFYILHVLLSSPTLLPMSLLIPTPTTNMDGHWSVRGKDKPKARIEQGVRKSLNSTKVREKAGTRAKCEEKCASDPAGG